MRRARRVRLLQARVAMSSPAAPTESAAPVTTEYSVAAPSPSFQVDFRPTPDEALHAQLTLVPRWMVYVGVLLIIGGAGPLVTWIGLSPLVVLPGLVGLFIAAPHLAYALASKETNLRIGASGLEVGPPGVSRAAAWETLLQVRVTRKIYRFTLRSGQVVVLPQRVLGAPERGILEDALARRPALVTRQEPASPGKAALWILGILVFVTIYNLFQTSGPRRPRHPRSGNTPTSSLRMPSSTDATGRSSFIEPTI
jgi:hypothetical protein